MTRYVANMPNGTTQPRRLLHPDDPESAAITAGGVRLSRDQLEERSLQVANAVAGAGIEPKEVWGVLAHNRAERAELSIGNTRAGTRLVPLNWRLTPVELAAMLDDSDCRLIFVDPAVRELAESATDQASSDAIIVVELGDEYER
jgi:acyl-CoA synthetase (AMP-forming)/AMP-acid ligase II